jgi:hypothetical protein
VVISKTEFISGYIFNEGVIFIEEYILKNGEVGLLVINDDWGDDYISPIACEIVETIANVAIISVLGYKKSKPPKGWKFVRRWLPRDFE